MFMEKKEDKTNELFFFTEKEKEKSLRFVLKFIFSKKTTKIDEIFTVDLTLYM